MNVKAILAGGIALFVGTWAISFATGPIVHEGILDGLYRSLPQFWRPELNQDPPDIGALMPRWLGVGFVGALVQAGVYLAVRGAFSGSGWLKGVKYGLVAFAIGAVFAAGWSGVFALPDKIWVWWTAESLVYMVAGGALMGFVVEKWWPAEAAKP